MFVWPELPAELRPPHVYIPGKTARHRDDWFDAIKATVGPQTDLSDLHRTTAFQTGLAYFGAGFFWECHEVLEAVWMCTDDPSPERDVVQALIQLANARLKLLMGRPRAAVRLCDMVQAHLARCPVDQDTLGLRITDLGEVLDTTQAQAKEEL